jgi:hypothetical protein
MKKILYVTPHLSTGGHPQYLCKKIECFNKEFDIWCVEYSNYSDEYVVQKNKIRDILKDKLKTLGSNKFELIEIVNQLNPDIIHFEEIPETFVNTEILDIIYDNKREYSILVTTHSSETNPKQLRYLADKFVLVSEWSLNVFKSAFGDSLQLDLWEYPIEVNNSVDKNYYKEKLGFDKNLIHVLNVGLFTPDKNQGELINLAKSLLEYNIQFHFVGNLATNFKYYWEPLLLDLPSNCKIHGEKSNVDEYLMASDCFYFTSNFELNPLVIKEALSYNLPIFMKKLKTYGKTYDGLVTYISEKQDFNKNELLETFNVSKDSISIILAHADTDWRKHLLKQCLSSIKTKKILSTNCSVSEDVQELCDYLVYTKENPLLYKEDYDAYGVVNNRVDYFDNGQTVINPFEYEHSYAVYCLMKNGLDLANRLGYKKVNFINYDYKIPESVLIENHSLLNENQMVVYKYENDYDSSYSSGFFSTQIETIYPFLEKYSNKKEFYSNYCLFENRLTNFIDENTQKTIVKSFSDLSSIAEVNREGVLSFSKEELFNPVNDFAEISNIYMCDKSTHHQYDKIYPKFIEKFRNHKISILEIGIDEGKSYKVWSDYFTIADIFGLDKGKQFKTDRGEVFLGDQSNMNDLELISEHIKSINDNCKLIVDDGSHIPEHQISTFFYLFEKLLKPGGVYIIEDIECSYWEPNSHIYGYRIGHLNIVDFFTKLNHEVNWRYNKLSNQLDIASITFGPNCIIITKIDYEKRN